MSAAELRPVRRHPPRRRSVDPGAMKFPVAGPSSGSPAQAGAASLLSTIGAGVAGAGIGILLANPLAGAGWPLLVAGLIAHGVGMIGNRRAQASQGYRPGRMEGLAYWSCWAGIAALLGYAIVAAAV